MRLGISFHPSHKSPAEWASKLVSLGCRAATFPCTHKDSDKRIDAYLNACRDHDLLIAEVGSWCNPMTLDDVKRAQNLCFCQEQLRLADYVGARCCVNISGSRGEIWDGGYRENYTEKTYREVIDTTRAIIDAVNPQHTFYTLEPMPWMVPDSPAEYRRLINDVQRTAFAVHMDVVNMISTPQRYFFNTEFIKECFDLLGTDIKSCHLKDIRLEPFLTFNLKESACGNGNLDIVSYVRSVNRLDPDMALLIEHLSSEEEYTASITYVKALLARHDVNILI